MPLARTYSVALIGVTGHVVEIEADIANGLPAVIVVGLPDTALREARDRIRAAITNSREEWPQRKITVGLSPASLPKRGSWFDLAIAIGILAAAGKVPRAAAARVMFFGELGLDGRLRPVCGVLPAVARAAEEGFGKVMVAEQNAAEAVLVPGVRVIAVNSLTRAADWLRGRSGPDGQPAAVEYQGGQDLPGRPGHAGRPGQDGKLASVGGAQAASSGTAMAPDLAELLGQSMARRAAEVCAAGGHHLSLLGPPGAGKTMLAERIPTILPRLDRAAAFEVTAVHSVAGTLPARVPLLEDPPFLAPHHTATKAAIVGGGSGVIRPGSASLAHRGVLFLDEAPEFARDVLDALRQPLEAGEVVVARSGITTRFPARFTLVLAANPCPCARVAGPSEGCSCSPATRRRYLGRISGPLLDRVDVKIELEPVSRKELLSDRTFSESSLIVARRVAQARERTAHRLQGTPWRLNGEVPGSALRRTWPPAPGSLAALERSLDRGLITARGVVKIVRVAWTLADLAGRPRPTRDDCDAALGLWLGVRR
ncbi:MAG TPA: YifB family Mg chelatase-like AAA ATPase [Streptosporangiaceae bacterium]|nr:YifB family Mg chelatase-like AAA ATPase [Streptosporangiaceae bacterium]